VLFAHDDCILYNSSVFAYSYFTYIANDSHNNNNNLDRTNLSLFFSPPPTNRSIISSLAAVCHARSSLLRAASVVM
jgi:hypothetical protein